MADDLFSPWASDPSPTRTPSATKANDKGPSSSTDSTLGSKPKANLFDDNLFDADAAWGVPTPTKEDSTDAAASRKVETTLPEEIWADVDEEEGDVGVAESKGEEQSTKEKAETSLLDLEGPQEQGSPGKIAKAEEPESEEKAEDVEEEEDEFGDAVESNTPPTAEEAIASKEDDPAAPAEAAHAPAGPPIVSADDDDFGDFDDEPTSPAANQNGASGTADDDFGDFDDGFGEEVPAAAAAPAKTIVEERAPTESPAPIAPGISDWKPLFIAPGSTADSVASSIREILSAPLALGNGAETGSYPFHDDAAKRLTKTAIRDVQGAGQVLVSDECRQLWGRLSALPPTRPIEWQRSRTRRDHLISLGVPVNLEEFTTPTSKPVLPPLALDVGGGASATAGKSGNGFSSASPGGASSNGREQGGSNGNGARGDAGAFAGTAAASRGSSRGREDRLGPKPDVDTKRAESIVEMSEDTLLLQSLPALRSLSKEVQNLTISVSQLLTYRLQQREALQADNETYNGLIKDLVAGAANRFGGMGSRDERRSMGPGGLKRTSTPMGRAVSSAAGKGQSPSGSRPGSPFTTGARR